MKHRMGKMSAFAGGTMGLMLWAGTSHGQVIVNPGWELPADTTDSTTTTVTGWTMSPAPNPESAYTNMGQRDSFYNNTPAGRWSFWLQTFTYQGNATQNVVGVLPGVNYNFTSQMSFQDGSAAGQGYNATTLANQSLSTFPAPQTASSPNGGNLYSYLAMTFLNAGGTVVGPVNANGYSDEMDISAGSVAIFNQTSGTQAGATLWEPYSVTGVAPAGATQVELFIGWNNGGLDGNTGGQSAFADDATLAPVPEPTSLGLLALGGLSLFGRRRIAAV